MTDAIGPKSSYDFAGLGELKARAASDRSDDAAIKKAAQQFEAMFLQMMMKSMRATVEKGGLFDSQASRPSSKCMTSRSLWRCRSVDPLDWPRWSSG